MNQIKREKLYNLKTENEDSFPGTGSLGLSSSRNQYQYQQQTADPSHIYRETPLGQALIKSLREMQNELNSIAPKSSLPEIILNKFDEVFVEQFDSIPTILEDEGSTRVKQGGQSLSQTLHNMDDSSFTSQATKDESLQMGSKSFSSNCPMKSENGYLSRIQGVQKINLNRNKMQGTCREYKHLDDEWKFNVDEFAVVEATEGNVFHDPASRYAGMAPAAISARQDASSWAQTQFVKSQVVPGCSGVMPPGLQASPGFPPMGSPFPPQTGPYHLAPNMPLCGYQPPPLPPQLGPYFGQNSSPNRGQLHLGPPGIPGSSAPPYLPPSHPYPTQAPGQPLPHFPPMLQHQASFPGNLPPTSPPIALPFPYFTKQENIPEDFQKLHESNKIKSEKDLKESALLQKRSDGGDSQEPKQTGTIEAVKLKKVKNFDCKFVPSPAFLAHVRKRSTASGRGRGVGKK